MRYFATLLCLFFTVSTVSAQEPAKLIKPPTTSRPLTNRPGIGKQEWQRPEARQPQVQPRPFRSYTRPYVHPFHYPSVETRFHPRYGFYRTYRPPVFSPYYGPPVIIQPQPVYPAPFQGFFFQFRF